MPEPPGTATRHGCPPRPPATATATATRHRDAIRAATAIRTAPGTVTKNR
ncbi:hypothetical protein [Streptomyces capoamus]